MDNTIAKAGRGTGTWLAGGDINRRKDWVSFSLHILVNTTTVKGSQVVLLLSNTGLGQRRRQQECEKTVQLRW